MDRENRSDIKYMAGGLSLDGRVHLLLSFAPEVGIKSVPDPYYDGNFEETYRLVEAGCRGLLEHIRAVEGV
mgnify:CR=1 FL=1